MIDGAQLLLVRHGRHDWLVPPINRLAGRLRGVHLNALGRTEAEALADRLAGTPPDRVLSSPLERTLETATIIADHVGRPVFTDERLIETGMGPWEGLPVSEAIRRSPDVWRAWRTAPTQVALPGMEGVGAIVDRMLTIASGWRWCRGR